MAVDKSLAQLDAVASVAAADQVEVLQSGANKRATFTQIFTSFLTTTPAVFSGAIVASPIYGGTAAGSTLVIAGTSHVSPVNAHISLNGAGQGWVSIGVATPLSNLHVQGAGPTSARIVWTDTGSFGGLYFCESATVKSGIQSMGSTLSPASRANDLEFFTATGGGMTFAPGNAGVLFEMRQTGAFCIGTGAAAESLYGEGAKLDVLGARGRMATFLSFTGGAVIADSTAFALGVGGSLGLAGKYNAGGAYWSFAQIAGMKASAVDGSAKGDFVVEVANTDGGHMAEGFRVSNDLHCRAVGALITRRVSVPADSDLVASSVAIWLDDTPGSTKLMIKAKDSGGTVRTGSVNLT